MGPMDRPPTTTTMLNGHNIKLPFKFIFAFPHIKAALSYYLRVEILFLGIFFTVVDG